MSPVTEYSVHFLAADGTAETVDSRREYLDSVHPGRGWLWSHTEQER